jgi:hypothetical protein
VAIAQSAPFARGLKATEFILFVLLLTVKKTEERRGIWEPTEPQASSLKFF